MLTSPSWETPHHDGSAAYVSDLAPVLGDVVSVFLRIPRSSGVRQALLRVYIDGEQELRPTVVDRQTEHEFWVRGEVPMLNPVVNYRWLLDGASGGYQWLNGEGLHPYDVTDAADFRLTSHPPPPSWALDAVVYQIFPDRFAKSTDREAPDWAVPQDWDDPVIGDGPVTPYQLYGGDLDGIAAHLDHIAALGANTVYLTPVFPSRSNHRYDASTFDRIDPLLGGDAALARLSDAVHARGMRLLGDLTTNHCGDTHEWFRMALADPASAESRYFIFDDHPGSYVCWFGHPSLPKLDHRDPGLRQRLYDGPESVVARWTGPHAFDGWRIDVANMTGRLGTTDLNHQVATTMRATLHAAKEDALLLAEHSHDASHDLLGDGWHGVMNYAGFTRPVWQWLKPSESVTFASGPFTPTPSFGGTPATTAMRSFAAAQPWRATAHALTLVGSHDTARIRTMLGDEDLVTVALGLLATLPGIPMLWAGDEIGQQGANGEDGRRPFPWGRADTWDRRRLEMTTALFRARADNVALRHGGLRWLSIQDDAITFLREAPDQTVLVHAARADHSPVAIPAHVLGDRLRGLAGTRDLAPTHASDFVLPSRGPEFHAWATQV